MFKKRKAQGLSVTTIILAVLGLIILTVIILMLTDKLGGFGGEVSKAGGCDDLCKAAGFGVGTSVDHPELAPDCKCEK